MDGMENFISVLDYILDTKAKKAHHRWNFGERVIAFWRIGPYGDDHKKQR